MAAGGRAVSERRAGAPRRRLSGAERRDVILDAAARQFAEAGYAGASIERISRAAGVSPPVIYDHFASKQALFVAVMERSRDELTARGAAAMRAQAPFAVRVRAAIEAFFAYVEEEPAGARVLLVTHRGSAQLQRAAREVQAEAARRLTSLLAAEPNLIPSAKDRSRRLELLVEFAMHGMHGLAEWWEEHPQVEREVLVDAAAGLVEPGLRAALERA